MCANGLPATPICSPGQPALAAAENPAPGDWLYFVTVDLQGTTLFTRDYPQHLANIELAKQNGVLDSARQRRRAAQGRGAGLADRALPVTPTAPRRVSRAGARPTGRYDRIECSAAELPSLVGGFGPEWVGVSVTMPGKFAALAFADERIAARRTRRIGQHVGADRRRMARRQHRRRRGHGCARLGVRRRSPSRRGARARAEPRPPPSSRSPSLGCKTSRSWPEIADKASTTAATLCARLGVDTSDGSSWAPRCADVDVAVSTIPADVAALHVESGRGRARAARRDLRAVAHAAGGRRRGGGWHRVIGGLQMLLQPGVRPGRTVHRPARAERGDESGTPQPLAFDHGGGGGLRGCVLAWFVGLSVYDVRQRRLPNWLTLPGATDRVGGRRGCAGRGVGALVGSRSARTLLYLVIHLVAPAGMGAGDVKLAIGVGALTGAFGPDVWVLGGARGAAADRGCGPSSRSAARSAPAPCRTGRRCASPRRCGRALVDLPP